MTNTVGPQDCVLVLVGNIPHGHHSSDLRNYFSQFIESGGFLCFHFRHRPETKLPKTDRNEATSSNINETSNSKRTLCCVVKVCRDRVDEFIAMYNAKHWINDKGDALRSLCFLGKMRITNSADTDSTPSSSCSENRTRYLTREEEKMLKKHRPSEEISQQDLNSLIELNPPDVMPNGNVGTPTKVFLDLIRACKLPPSIIRKLGLAFPRMRSNKLYGNVPFEYDSSPKLSEPLEIQTVITANGHILTPGEKNNLEKDEIGEPSSESKTVANEDKIVISEVLSPGKQEDLLKEELSENSLESKKSETEANQDHVKLVASGVQSSTSEIKKTKRKRKRPKVDLSLDDGDRKEEKTASESDSDDCEDWERHEVLHDDSANAERNKQRVYEEELEVVWEKGGSGLVFYTDAQHWKQQEGDFDEQTADDWDVDMEIYTDPTAGDMDARNFMEMRQEQRRRKGIVDRDLDPNHIGQFEKHTKGFGRKVMEKQGWKEGEGLGSWTMGMSEALHNEGQAPGVRAGIGYTGEKLQRFGLVKKPRRDTPGCISTIYDNPKDTDPQEPLLRREGSYHLKHRPHFVPKEGHLKRAIDNKKY